jgi:hypothetical protein
MKIRKNGEEGREVNSEGIQGSYKPSVKLKSFWEHEDKRKFSSPLRQTRKKKETS